MSHWQIVDWQKERVSPARQKAPSGKWYSYVVNKYSALVMPIVVTLRGKIFMHWRDRLVFLIINWAALSAVASEQASATKSSDDMATQIEQERLAIAREREWANYQHRLQEIDCYKKFFVNVCLDENQEQLRQTLSSLRQREINNNQAQRVYDAQQREAGKAQAAAEKEKQQPLEETRREQNSINYQQKIDEAQRRQNEQVSPQKEQERRQNIEKYTQKQKEAYQRQQELEKRQQKNQQPSQTTPVPVQDDK